MQHMQHMPHMPHAHMQSGDNQRHFPRTPTPPSDSTPIASFLPMHMQGSSPNQVPLGHYVSQSQPPYLNPANPASSAVVHSHAGSRTSLTKPSSKKWMWWVVALLVLGATAGALLAVFID